MAPPKPALMWPLTISAGVNDTLRIQVGATRYTATIAAGTYYTPTSLAAAVLAALNAAVANSWTVGVSVAGRFVITGSTAFLVSRTTGTNRLLYSQQFDNAAWTKRGTAAVAANAGALAPDGTATADRVSGIGAAGVNDLFQAATGFTANEALAPSVWIQRVSTSGTLVIANAQGGGTGALNVDLAAIGAGWVRVGPGVAGCTVTTPFVATSGGAAGLQFYAGAGPLSFDLWQAQMEPGDYPGAWVLTTGAVVAPAADGGPPVLGFSGNTQAGTQVTSQAQHQNAWYADDPVVDDSGDRAIYERSQTVALSGKVRGATHATRYRRAIVLGSLAAWKVWSEDEGTSHLNEALERLLASGWARFRWFPDQTLLGTGTDYALDLKSAEALPRDRLSPGAALYSLTLQLRKYV